MFRVEGPDVHAILFQGMKDKHGGGKLRAYISMLIR